MLIRLITEIIAFLIGRKYYANIIVTKGTAERQLCSYIFRTREEADKHKAEVETTLSFKWVETITFHSKQEY